MKKRKIVGPAIVGNIVEYYDFGIYAVYAKIIGELFFPSSSEFLQTLSSLAVFAVGFLMRPVGGVFFGHIGDRVGRKAALTISVIGMALATLCIGLLPGYREIGVMAPILLVLIRLFQGMCVGGEGAGSAIFILEHLEGYKPGLIGGIVQASNMFGALLANFVAIVVGNFYGNDDFAWRIGFFFGGAMGVVGLYLRFSVTETPQFQDVKESNKLVKMPLLQAMRDKWRRLILIAALGGSTSAMAYIIRGYFNTYFIQTLEYSDQDSKYFTATSLFIFILFLPMFGIMADRVGYRKFLYIVSYTIVATVIPIFMLISNEAHDVSLVFIGLFLFSLLSAAICAPAYPYAASALSPELRYSGVAFSWNMGIAIFGGTTPAISSMLAQGIAPYAPSFYLVLMALLFIKVSFLTRKDKH
ncbi:MAG: MFS transporter [Proteobacteria bacterium]|nr:MFS transporter [Pseudomonadota bacterium]